MCRIFWINTAQGVDRGRAGEREGRQRRHSRGFTARPRPRVTGEHRGHCRGRDPSANPADIGSLPATDTAVTKRGLRRKDGDVRADGQQELLHRVRRG